ncbi:MAG: Holliday junction branch migration protein RuvA [Tannerella sp.]|jgi:Holliday junction DNA helicase RuvA|nr:Holliday junction branch migration protein RuvA [Tannerella sp.]
MIEYIRGEIAELSPTQMVLECSGIGYELNISLTTYSAFNGLKEGKIYVYEVIREDAHLLYGFATREERELFLLLTSVSGVGPNTARMILSSLPPFDLIHVIASGDDVSLTSIKGIGSKTAQRIVVDLRNKVRPIEGLSGKGQSMAGGRSSDTADGAVAALVMLGFQKIASQKAVASILKKTPSIPVEQAIKDALKIL